MGGSNGGLLVGNMIARQAEASPSLFGAVVCQVPLLDCLPSTVCPQLTCAVVCQVPLLDMQRYHKLLAGASWMAEFGNPDTSDWEGFLKSNSPYHNLKVLLLALSYCLP